MHKSRAIPQAQRYQFCLQICHHVFLAHLDIGAKRDHGSSVDEDEDVELIVETVICISKRKKYHQVLKLNYA